MATPLDDDAAWILEVQKAIDAQGGVQMIFGIVKHKSDIEVHQRAEFENPTTLPPCLQAVARELESGGSPGHMARFALAAFLLKRDTSPEDIHSFFKNASNYTEAMTTHQIESIVRKGYAPPSCQRLRQLGLCKEDDVCRDRGCETPLSYPRSAGS